MVEEGGFFGKGALAKGEAALWGQLFGGGSLAKATLPKVSQSPKKRLDI
jgi:hypothetical protein